MNNPQNSVIQKSSFLPVIPTTTLPQPSRGNLFNSFFNKTQLLSKSHSLDNFNNSTQDFKQRTFINPKSMKNISNKSPIDITPSEIIFRDVVVNQTYEMSIYVRNLSKIVRRIRIFQPQNTKFRCDYDMAGAIAAGLAMKLRVSFETTVLGEFEDKLKIISDDNITLEIPLSAYPMQSQVIFEPFLNFGFVKMGSEKTKSVSFKNEGKTIGRIELKVDKLPDITVDPNFFTLTPGQEGSVNIKYRPKDAGILRGNLSVIVDGGQTFQKFIEINATSVEFNRFLIDETGNLTRSLDFGTVYFGQQKEIKTFLVNNTPKSFHFKSKFRIGFQREGGLDNYQTPNEVGYEQTEKIVSCAPEEGLIDSYSQTEVVFKCKPKLTDKYQTWTKIYAMSKEEHEHQPEEFEYTAYFDFNNETDSNTNISFSIIGVCPKVKLSCYSFNFSECAAYDHRDIPFELENKSDEHSIDLSFERISTFSVTSNKYILKPQEKAELVATFCPKNLGNFNIDFHLYLIKGQYKLPLKFVGTCNTLIDKIKKPRGLESLPESFIEERKFLNDDTVSEVFPNRSKKIKEKMLLSWQSLAGSRELIEELYKQFSDKYFLSANPDEMIYKEINKKVYNDYMKSSRFDRSSQIQQKKINSKMLELNEKLKEMGLIHPEKETNEVSDDENNANNPNRVKVDAPIDQQFFFGLRQTGDSDPKLGLPEKKDSLYVERPIAQYEPSRVTQSLEFNPDPNAPLKKKFPSEPKSHKEIRDTNMELTGEMLQKIFAGPKLIDFGMIFVKSSMTKTFTVRNDLRNSIMVKLEITYDELKGSYSKPQVIPPGEIATFDVVLSSNRTEEFRGAVKYIINNKPSFEFLVTGLIELVTIEPETNSLKFAFDDNNDMEVAHKIWLKNKGNAAGRFRWLLHENKVFSVEPKDGEIPAFGKLEAKIIYRPSGTAAGKNEDEKITMKVEDGFDQIIKCSGYVQDSKCQFNENTLDLGEIPVCKVEERAIQIKNCFRHPTVYRVQTENLPPFTRVIPEQDRLSSEELKYLKVIFSCSKELAITDGTITISVRGGRPIKMDFKATTIIPKVSIMQEQLDFGGITTLGNPGVLEMVINNEATIPATLILDLRERMDGEFDGVECLNIEYVKKKQNEDEEEDDDEEEMGMVSINEMDSPDNSPKKGDSKPMKEKQLNQKASLAASELDDEEEAMSDASESVVEEQKQSSRHYKILIKKQAMMHFLLKFTPKDAKNYNFELPLTLENFGKLESLTKVVKCKGLKPKLLIDPQLVDFKKKIIANDKFLPTIMEVSLMNPDMTAIHYFIDTSELDDKKVFSIYPAEGTIEGGQTIYLKASFNPYKEESYAKTVPLFIDGEKKRSYLDIHFKGVGAYPKLTFDKREVIMPIVPLGIVTKCQFKVINDGYENLTLKEHFANDFSGNLHLKYLEGKNLGVTKNKIKLEVSFYSEKPFSFTTKLDFADNDGRNYTISVSATCDNCLFTNYSYFQRYAPNEYRLVCEENKPIMLQDDFSEGDSEKNSKKYAMGMLGSKAGSAMSSKSAKSAIGYVTIQMHVLEKSCEMIVKWLNYFSLSSMIQTFPNDIINGNGSQIFDVMASLTGKPLNFKAKIDVTMKKVERMKALIQQYDKLIELMKKNGAFLNTIRPYYLISFSEYNLYVKNFPSEFVNNNAYKMSEQRFRYLSLDCWITLFYQIMKIYSLNKVTVKSMRNVPNIPQEKLVIPDYYLEGSNLYSTSENILLRWLELYTEQMSPVAKPRLQNFSLDLRDSLCFLYLLQGYIGSTLNKMGVNLKPVCKNEEDYLFNAEKILNALFELGLETHLKPKDLANANDRDMLLFLIHIFNSLGAFIPQKEPIIFSCILGDEIIKFIELTNPSSKPVAYWVKYDGHSDFSIEENNIRIEPRSVVKFKVKFTSRISTPVTGRLTFSNKKETTTQAAALVFDLKSQVTDRKSLEKFSTSSPLYQSKQETLQIKNIFTNSTHEFGEFLITLVNEKVDRDDENSKKRKGGPPKKSQKTKNATNKQSNKESTLNLLPPFFCSKEKIRLKKGESASLIVMFMPCFLETYRCKLIFIDKEVGEFQYEIIGEALMPDPLSEIRPNTAIQVHVDTHVHYEHPISFKNDQLSGAKKVHENRLMTTGKMKEGLNRFKQQVQQPDEMMYSIEIQPPNSNVSVPFNFRLADPNKIATKKSILPEKDSKISSSNNLPADNKLPFDFSFKQPINNFSCAIIMRSEDKSDIRIYRLVVSSSPKPIRGIIELKCPAGEELKQQIPFVNNTDKDWKILSTLTYDVAKFGPGIFTGPKDLQVKKKATANYVLGFQPQIAESEVEGKLVLVNQITNEHYEYELNGKSEEPLSKSHLLINCIARRPEKRVIEVQNPYLNRAVTYEVETDLINSEGATKFTIDAGRTYKYQLTVTPVMGGVYTGSITFFEEQDKHKYIWYTVCINTDKPRSEKTVELTTYVRKTLAFEISLCNPLKEALTYEVSIEGEGLTGDTLINILPQQTIVYELRFTPLRAFKGRGSIAFIQEKLGELWYDLVLNSENKPVERLSTLKAELGKFSQHEVILENPSGFNVVVSHRVSNPNNFDVIPDVINIPALSAVSAYIRYTPSDLEVNETGEVIFESEEIGNWYYMVFGVGLPPTKFDPKIISCGLNKDLSQSINFKNPFKEPITIVITLEALDKNKDVFQLLLRKNKIVVQGLSVFQIPMLFAPREINEYQCEITVFMNEKIQWRYPIKGVTESFLNNITYNFKVKSRETLVEELKIVLPGLPKDLCNENFNLEIDNVPMEFLNLINKSFKITPIKTTLSDPEDHLKFKVHFNPMKPFKSSIDILIFIESGGRWKFKLNLEATEPEEDDVIQIFSPINKTSSVSFRLANRFKNYSPFTAFFSPDSDPEFSVMPRTGELEPYGREGKNFIISFTPVEYGKMKQGKLVVQTDELYWSFLVRGTFPQYKPPETRSMVNDKIDPELMKIRSVSNKNQKNFLLENIKKSKQSPEKKHFDDKKSFIGDRTLMNTLSKTELSKTSFNMYTNKDLSYMKAGNGKGRKNDKLDPLVVNSYKIKTSTDGFNK